MITEQQLADMQDRCDKATAEPWGTIPPGGPNGPFWGICNRMGNIVAMRLTNDPRNATFIAASRTDLPLLIAEVRRLREALQKIADDDTWSLSDNVGARVGMMSLARVTLEGTANE